MASTQFPWLSVIIALPLLASLLIPIIPDQEKRSVGMLSESD